MSHVIARVLIATVHTARRFVRSGSSADAPVWLLGELVQQKIKEIRTCQV